MKKINRREMLRMSGIAAFTYLSGCCKVAPRIPSDAEIIVSDNVRRLSPVPCYENICSPVIDAHGHFFNVTDIQAGGYLAGPIVNEYVNLEHLKPLKELAEFLGEFIQLVGNMIAPHARKEWNDLNVIPSNLMNVNTHQFILNEVDRDLENTSRKFYDALVEERKLEKFNSLFKQALISGGLKSTFVKQNVDADKDTLYFAMTATPTQMLEKYSEVVDNFPGFVKKSYDFRKVFALLSFVGRMLSRRYSNMVIHREAFASNQTALKTKKVTDVMVDFNYWLGKCEYTFSNMEDQLRLHGLIHELSEGYTIPVLPFNPWVAHVEGDNYFTLFETAINKYHFKGAKIYPTIGYYPDGRLGSKSDYTVDFELPNERYVIEAMSKFYDICEDKNIFVMSHGNHSMGASRNFLKMAGYKAWGQLLHARPNLKVNIGHVGGNHDDERNANWTKNFARLMEKHSGLYGDIGYWDELSDGEGVKEFAQLVNANPIFAKRVMYGTDWFMLDQEIEWRSYMNNIHSQLEKYLTKEQVNDIFYNNAATFFD